MPKYTANVYLVHHGKVIPIGDTVELTEEQAKLLGEKVTLVDDPSLDDLTVAELKDMAKSQGIEGYAEMKKAELITALSGK